MFSPLVWFAAATVAVHFSVGVEVELSPGMRRGTVVLVDLPWPPVLAEQRPSGVPVRTSWYRLGDRYLASGELARDTVGDGRETLRFAPEASSHIARVTNARGAAEPLSLPLAEPISGHFVALRLPARSGPRALLVRGELGDAWVLSAGERLIGRAATDAAGISGASVGRTVYVVPEGKATTVLLVAREAGAEVKLLGASLHVANPLPAPESFVLEPGRKPETITFEVPARPEATVVRFEGFDVEPGELRIELEGWPVFVADAEMVAGGWSDAIEVVLPEQRMARGRPSFLTFRLRPGTAGRGEEGVGIRAISLDEPLPAEGPFGGEPGGHPRGLRFSFRALASGDHVLRLHAAGLSVPDQVEVLLDGRWLETLGATEGGGEFDVVIDIPAPLVRSGETQSVVLRCLTEPPSSWAVSEVRVERKLPAPDLPRPQPAMVDGPTPSQAPVGLPGQTPQSGWLGTTGGESVLPGQPSEPIGTTDLFFGVPVNQPELGEAVSVALRPWAATVESSSVRLDPGPVRSGGRLIDGGRGTEALPGQGSLVPGPESESRPEWRPTPAPRGRGAALEIVTEPPGAAVFAASAGGYQGAFLGLTPVIVPGGRSGPVLLRLVRPGYHDASVVLWVPPTGRARLDRALLPWRGVDFSRPAPIHPPRKGWFPEGYTAPAPGDLDLDGRLDLVVGDRRGSVWWLRDEATDGPASFGRPRPLHTSTGERLQVEGYAVPVVVDWDRDGRLDLLVGSESGEVHFYRRALSSTGLAFENRGVLVADGSPLGVGNDAAPLVIDWNGDSSPDILVGSGYGIIVLFLNRGDGELTEVGPVSQRGDVVQGVLDLVPVDLEDWTGDGLRDLLVADRYGSLWVYGGRYEAGSRPDFDPPRRLTHRGGLELEAGSYPHGFALDMNGDGLRDLVIGNAAGELSWYSGGEPGDFDELEPVAPIEPPHASR